ncbi:hypothetical protein PAXINDRAFT_165097 [Paxillus involutus ATCC 200175]|nr:hypothetical protein PAXINDRAFT_165097 [Paxillus involutus ATCC 200175]
MLLLLADSGQPFTLEEYTVPAWTEMKKSGQVTPSYFPCSTVPVLRVSKFGQDCDDDLYLGESPVIISFLEEYLAPKGVTTTKDMPLEIRARMEMVKEASLYTSGRIMLMSGKEDWLAPPNRDHIYRDVVMPYLRNTEHALSALKTRAKIIPEQSDSLTGLSVTVTATLNLVMDIFPHLRDKARQGGEFNCCGQLWEVVMNRPGIEAYWKEKQMWGKNWTYTRFASAEWIAKEAKEYDSNDTSNL